VLDAFNPLGGSSNMGQMLSPTPFDPAIALMQNRDWTGKPIYREDSSELDPTPGHTRTKDSASWISRHLSELLGKATGGTDYQPGAINWTPDQIDYIVGQLTGGVGRELMKVETTLTSPFNGDELPPHKIPLVGRVYGNTRGPASESEKFYENLTKLNGVERELKGRARDGQDVGEYMAEEPMAALVGMGNAAENQLSKLRQYRREVVRQGLPGYQSDVKDINAQIGEVMKSVNQEVRRAKTGAAEDRP
jgi:Large polyvalent protein associated domain 38